MRHALFLMLPLYFLGFGCKQQTSNFGMAISEDPQLIENGEASFNRLCSACHNFNGTEIGPNLRGITRSVQTEWIENFIRDPKKVIDSNDERAVKLYKKFNVYMQGFPALEDKEMEEIISYLHTYDNIPLKGTEQLHAIENPIEDTIGSTEIVLDLDFYLQIPPSHHEFPYTRINKIDCERDSERLFVNDLRGTLYEIINDKPFKFLQLDSLKSEFIQEPGLGTGFGSFAFHPEFSENGLLYTTHAESGSEKPADFAYSDSIQVTLQWVITEWKFNDPRSNIFVGSDRELMRIDFVSGIHGMQEISFNPTSDVGDPDFGMLYVGIGDGGSVLNEYPHISFHNGNEIWSSILRIDPTGNNSSNQKYGIPVDNPFAGVKDRKGEIWAYGFRNPNKITWDNSGRLLATDIGQAQIEEVNVVEAGKFYGWPIREGSFVINPYGDISNVYSLPENDDSFSVSYPFMQFDHDDGQAISGGYVGNGKHEGKYIFGDIVQGKLFISDIHGSGTVGIEKANISVENKLTDFYDLTGGSRVDLRFGKDCSGTIFAFTKADGRIYKIRDK